LASDIIGDRTGVLSGFSPFPAGGARDGRGLGTLSGVAGQVALNQLIDHLAYRACVPFRRKVFKHVLASGTAHLIAQGGTL
jgi:hypothetical protein